MAAHESSTASVNVNIFALQQAPGETPFIIYDNYLEKRTFQNDLAIAVVVPLLPRWLKCWEFVRKIISNKLHQIPYQPKVQNKQKVVPKKLRRLINDNPNITIRELAVFFGCNRSTIYRSLKRHNISYQNKRQRPPNVDPKKLENLIKKHPIATMKELAKFIGCHESAVGRTLKRHNIYYQHKPSRNKKINIELLRKFAEENSEIDIKELATHFGCTEPSIFSALKRHGIVYKLKQRPKYELRSHANQNTFRSQERHSRKIDVGELRKRINENPQAKLAELAEPFGCSHQAISKVIKTHKIPYKTKYGIYPRKRCRGESRALPS